MKPNKIYTWSEEAPYSYEKKGMYITFKGRPYIQLYTFLIFIDETTRPIANVDEYGEHIVKLLNEHGGPHLVPNKG